MHTFFLHRITYGKLLTFLEYLMSKTSLFNEFSEFDQTIQKLRFDILSHNLVV